jgi:hypothetical protein
MKRIKLTQGKYAIVDDEDYAFLNRLDWYLNPANEKSHAIACRSFGFKGRHFEISMQSLLIRQKKNGLIRHRNGDGLDNRKSNLELINPSVMKHSAVKNRFKLSSYKGVSFNRYCKYKRWRAEIMKQGKKYFLGGFRSEEEAALAYNDKAKELYGEFAYQNVIFPIDTVKKS